MCYGKGIPKKDDRYKQLSSNLEINSNVKKKEYTSRIKKDADKRIDENMK